MSYWLLRTQKRAEDGWIPSIILGQTRGSAAVADFKARQGQSALVYVYR